MTTWHSSEWSEQKEAPPKTIGSLRRRARGRAKLVVCLASVITALSSLPCDAQSPRITSVSQISTLQNQTIVITGSGFGNQAPYSGDSSYILLLDVTNDNWSAGYAGPCFDGACDDLVTLIVESWSDSSIVLGGFSGAWGSNGWTLNRGDEVRIDIWDAESGNGPASITTTVVTQLLQITTTSVPNATSGQPYSATLSASGGSGSGYTWSLSSGTVPAGFTLSSGRVLSSKGTPPAPPNSYNVTVQVTDSDGNSATQALTLVVLCLQDCTQTLLLSSPAVAPSAFTYTGGTATLSTTIQDTGTGGVQQALAKVQLPNGTTTAVTLTLTAGSATNGTWEGQFSIPTNFGSTSQSTTCLFGLWMTCKRPREGHTAIFGDSTLIRRRSADQRSSQHWREKSLA